MFLVINSIPIGKTTYGSAQHGQATKHKDVNLCAVGSMSMYLNYWFYNTREFNEFTLEDWPGKAGMTKNVGLISSY